MPATCLPGRPLLIVVLLCGSLATYRPEIVRATRPPLHRVVGSPSAATLFASAMNALGHVGRYQLQDTGRQLSGGQAPAYHADRFLLRFQAPDRFSATDHQSGASLQSALDWRQIGALRCVYQATWNCQRAALLTPAAAAEGHLLLLGHTGTRFGSVSATARTWRLPLSNQVRASGQPLRLELPRRTITFDRFTLFGILTVDRVTRLPLRFSAEVRSHGYLFSRHQVSFTYGGTFSITLPRAGTH